MPVQIDRMETSVEIAPPASPPGTERPPARPDDPGIQTSFREAVMKVLADELDNFSRMRGH